MSSASFRFACSSATPTPRHHLPVATPSFHDSKVEKAFKAYRARRLKQQNGRRSPPIERVSYISRSDPRRLQALVVMGHEIYKPCNDDIDYGYYFE